MVAFAGVLLRDCSGRDRTASVIFNCIFGLLVPSTCIVKSLHLHGKYHSIRRHMKATAIIYGDFLFEMSSLNLTKYMLCFHFYL